MNIGIHNNKGEQIMHHSTEHLDIGYKIKDHYEIQKVLGQGGFGIVYLVKDTERLNNIFVIKELFAKEFSFRKRDERKVTHKPKAITLMKKIKEGIIREVKILSQIENENVVQAYGYLEENNTLYSIMEYIEGIDLGRCIEERLFSEDEAKDLLKQLIHGLKEIHKQDIVHRDIKPNNIMKTPDGIYKMIDFSTNKKYADNNITAITGFTNHIFTSPELQETKAIIKKSSDIYSIGMTLLRVLSDEERLPNLTDRLTDQSNNDSKFLYYIDILDISKEFKEIIKKMTAIKAENRYQNLEEIEEALKSNPKPKPKPRFESIKTEIKFAPAIFGGALLTVLDSALSRGWF
jgi:serine/threonine protein kinase